MPHIHSELTPTAGKSLIASPFLKDPYFLRSVVYLCDHNEVGSFGFILNKAYHQSLQEVMPDTFNRDFKLHIGGPVQPDTVHFLHTHPELIEGGVEVQDNVYWGGDFEQLIGLINKGQITEENVKFFLGYSGWSAGQLGGELEEESWIVSESKKQLLFDREDEKGLWAKFLNAMGSDYAIMTHFPIDPSLN